MTSLTSLTLFWQVRSHGRRVRKWSVRGTSQEEKNIRSETRTAKIVFTVLSLFGICWLPFVIVHLVHVSPNISIPPGVFMFVTFVAACHSACNPIIYITMNRKFRGEFLNMCPLFRKISRFCCCFRKGPLKCSRCGVDNKVGKFDLELSENSYQKSPITSPDSAAIESFASGDRYDLSSRHSDVTTKDQTSWKTSFSNKPILNTIPTNIFVPYHQRVSPNFIISLFTQFGGDKTTHNLPNNWRRVLVYIRYCKASARRNTTFSYFKQ